MDATPEKLMRLLRRLFAVQAQDAAARTTLDGPPDLRHLAEPMADAVRPLLLSLTQQGAVQSAARIAAKRGREKGVMWNEHPRPSNPLWAKGVLDVDKPAGATPPRLNPAEPGRLSLTLERRRVLVCKAPRKADVEFAFDLFNPRVLDAVDRAVLALCQDTLATASEQADEAVRQLRELLRQGMPRGEANALLAVKVRRIFDDPYRAFRIATTASSDVIHDGQMLAAKELGIRKWSWLASSDACPLCLKLDGKTVDIGKPFYVDPRGGPYAVKTHPPAHPFCFCTATEEI